MNDPFTLRRAGPRDVDRMVAFLNRALRGKPKTNRRQVLESFGEQGYMLGEAGGEIQAVIGWNTEDFIARVRQVVIYPARLRRTVGRATMEAVCQAAYELMCEVALLFPPEDASGRARTFFRSCRFQTTAIDDLIPAWRRAAQASMPDGTFVMVRKLREKRVMRPV